jgi:hypothetical protein
MSKFETYQGINYLEFTLYKTEEDLEVSFTFIEEKKGKYSCVYHYMTEKCDGEPIELFFRNKQFTLSYEEWEELEGLHGKIDDIIVISFYELMSLIKQHPKWRVKALHILDDSSREIWNIV